MGDLTKNISKHELKCKGGSVCNCNVTIDKHAKVISEWQKCCDYFAEKYSVKKVTLVITSAARCYVWNRTSLSEGGPGSTDKSQHPRCNAIDGKIFVGKKQVPPKDVYDYFDKMHHFSCGVGLYDSFTHFDTRENKSRWNET